MTYQGHVENGTIVLDEPTALPDGTAVKIELAVVDPTGENEAIPTLFEQLARVIGKAEGLPADWAENHDAYLREEHGG